MQIRFRSKIFSGPTGTSRRYARMAGSSDLAWLRQHLPIFFRRALPHLNSGRDARVRTGVRQVEEGVLAALSANTMSDALDIVIIRLVREYATRDLLDELQTGITPERQDEFDFILSEARRVAQKLIDYHHFRSLAAESRELGTWNVEEFGRVVDMLLGRLAQARVLPFTGASPSGQK